MNNVLTKRQQILYERLEILKDRIVTKTLPIRIEEIWLFGSFIRGKKNPKDLDICLRYSNRIPEYNEFRDLFEKIVRKKHESVTPQEALRQITESEFTGKNKKERSDIFCEWIDGITWSKIHREEIPLFISGSSIVTTRILSKDLPRIHITETVMQKENFSLKTDVMELAWSRNNDNLHENILNILSEENIHRNNLKELNSLENQIEKLKLKFPRIKITKKISNPNNLKFNELFTITEAKRQELEKLRSEYED